jgi:hypothetical protein
MQWHFLHKCKWAMNVVQVYLCCNKYLKHGIKEVESGWQMENFLIMALAASTSPLKVQVKWFLSSEVHFCNEII